MSNSDLPKYTLNIYEDDPTVLISVIDSQNRICATNHEKQINVGLPRGLYRIRAERDGKFADTIVRLNSNKNGIKLNLPPRLSTAPLPGVMGSNEDHMKNARGVSFDYTASPDTFSGDQDSSLMLFVRTLDKNPKTNGNLMKGLRLRTADGETISVFSKAELKTDQKTWAGWSAEAPAASVILEVAGAMERQIPIQLSPGFQTQIYILFKKRPLIETMRVFSMPKYAVNARKHQNPDYFEDEFSGYENALDIGISALQNGVKEIGVKLVNKCLNSKFQYPLLGMIGAYLLVLRRRENLTQSKGADLLNTVIHNLTGLMPGSADVAALKILAEPWIGPQELEPIENVPMFMLGTEAVIERAAKDDHLIPEGSLLDLSSDRLVADSVWTAWEPINLSSHQAEKPDLGKEMSWVESAIADAITNSHVELSKSNLAEQIGVTKSAIKNHYANLIDRAIDQPDKIEDTGYDISKVRRSLSSRVSGDLFEANLAKIFKLNRLAPVTYQNIYPSLKKAFAEVKGGTGQVLADDRITDLFSQESKREAILSTVEDSLGVTLNKLDQSASQVSTVRDVATLVIAQAKKKI